MRRARSEEHGTGGEEEGQPLLWALGPFPELGQEAHPHEAPTTEHGNGNGAPPHFLHSHQLPSVPGSWSTVPDSSGDTRNTSTVSRCTNCIEGSHGKWLCFHSSRPWEPGSPDVLPDHGVQTKSRFSGKGTTIESDRSGTTLTSSEMESKTRLHSPHGPLGLFLGLRPWAPFHCCPCVPRALTSGPGRPLPLTPFPTSLWGVNHPAQDWTKCIHSLLSHTECPWLVTLQEWAWDTPPHCRNQCWAWAASKAMWLFWLSPISQMSMASHGPSAPVSQTQTDRAWVPGPTGGVLVEPSGDFRH